MSERWTNFTASVRNLQWNENWEDRNHFAEAMLYAHRRARDLELRQHTPGNFAAEWQKAMDTRELSQVLMLLQGTYQMNNKIEFIPDMNAAFDKNRMGTSFYGDVPSDIVDCLESANPDLCCSLSTYFMHIPVYIEGTDSKGKPVKQYFDFIHLLKALETTNKNPLNREVIVDLTKIKYDAEKYDAIQNLLKNAREDNNSPVLLSGGPRKRSASGENSVVEEDGELDMTILPNRALSNTTMGFGN